MENQIAEAWGRWLVSFLAISFGLYFGNKKMEKKQKNEQ